MPPVSGGLDVLGLMSGGLDVLGLMMNSFPTDCVAIKVKFAFDLHLYVFTNFETYLDSFCVSIGEQLPSIQTSVAFEFNDSVRRSLNNLESGPASAK